MLKKLLSNVTIVKPGTYVKVRGESAKVFIRYATIYPDDSVVYTGYSNLGEGGFKNWNTIYPSEIIGNPAMTSIDRVDVKEEEIVKSESSDNSQTINTNLHTVHDLVKLLMQVGSLGDYLHTKEPIVITKEKYDKSKLKYALAQTSGYGYIGNDIVLSNDRYYIKYYKTDEVFIPIEYFTRKVELKSFMKRLWPTIKYGRAHPDNFQSIESDYDFIKRIILEMSKDLDSEEAILFNHRHITL